MRVLARLRSLLRGVFRREHMDQELDEELRGYLEELQARNERNGLAPEEARRAALRELGGVQDVKRDVRASWLVSFWDAPLQDVGQAWRGLRQTPGLSLVAVLTFALGIGATTAVVGVVKATLFTPPPFLDPSRLVVVWAHLPEFGNPRTPLSGPELQDLRTRTSSFEGIGAIWTNQIVLTEPGEPEFVRIGFVTPDFFSLLGVRASAGRTFQPSDDDHNGPPALLLSWALWQRRFGGDPDVVGRTIAVNEGPAQVIGVLPSDFRLRLTSDSGIPDALEAYQVFPWDITQAPRGQKFLRVVGRIKPNVGLADAAHEVRVLGLQVSRETGARRERVFRTVSLEAETTQEVRAPLFIVSAGVGLLLLVSAVNVLGVLAARAAARRREIAVRVALGAGMSRILRLALAEGLTLALLGAGLGILAGRALLAGLLALQPVALRRLAEVEIDWPVVGVATALAVLWGGLFALAPLGAYRRSDVSALLGSARAEGQRLRLRARSGFVIAQLAATAVLLVGAGLLTRTFARIQAIDPGFDANGVLAFRVPSATPRFSAPGAPEELGRKMRAALLALPSVTGAGATSHLPYDNIPNWGGGFALADDTREAAPTVDYRCVSPGFFEALRVELLAGRFFSAADHGKSERVAIVDDTLAARAWPGESALGKRLKVDPGSTGTPKVWVTVVGVVRHMRHRSLVERLTEQVYFPLSQAPRNPVAYVVRAGGDLASLLPSVRGAVKDVDSRLPLYEEQPLMANVERARGVQRFTMILVGVFASVSIVLASVGLYGVIAYLVVQRRREYGVRMALGATRGQIVRLVLREGARLLSIGGALGLLVSLGAGQLLRSQLYGVTPADAVTYAVALPVLAASALLACWWPARRAVAADVLEVLRAE